MPASRRDWAWRVFSLASIALWLILIALWIRARFATGALSTTTTSNHLLRLQSSENGIELIAVTGWPYRDSITWNSAPNGGPVLYPMMLYSARLMQRTTLLPGIVLVSAPGTLMTKEPPVGAVHGDYIYVRWLWPLGLTTAPALLVIWREIRALRTRRARRLIGMCRKCGYDLRASTDRCPECGTAIAETSARPQITP
jgi:hypothetical protein